MHARPRTDRGPALLRAARTDRDPASATTASRPARGARGRAVGDHRRNSAGTGTERRARARSARRPLARGRPARCSISRTARLRRGPNVERRLAGNVLVWTEGDRTFRLEGRLNKGQMLELGSQDHPVRGQTGAPLRPNRENDDCGGNGNQGRDRAGRGLAGRAARDGRATAPRTAAQLARGRTSTCISRSSCSRSGCPPDLALQDPALASRSRRLPAESCAGEFPRVHSVAVAAARSTSARSRSTCTGSCCCSRSRLA